MSRYALLIVLFSAALLGSRPVHAQQIWEYSPYSIRVVLAVDEAATLSPQLAGEWRDALVRGARSAVGYPWIVAAGEVPDSLRYDLVFHADTLTSTRILAELKPEANVDKIFLAAVKMGSEGYETSVREFDVRAQWFGEPRRASCAASDAVPETLLAGMMEAFSPLVKIEKVEGTKVVGRLRAGRLLLDAAYPCALEAGAVLLPVVRRNARNGDPLENGIQAPAWSYLQIESRTDDVVQAKLYAGLSNVIPAKGGPRTERLALGIRPTHDSTRLVVQTREMLKPIARDAKSKPQPKSKPEPPRPLVGYEVFARNPGEENTEFIGFTDWRGAVEIPVGKVPLRTFYVRNGGQFLARLPMMPGRNEIETAKVIDDDKRLQAEAIVKALQSRVMDLVARREILAVRVRAKIKKGEFAEARKLVEEFRTIPTNNQLRPELEGEQQRLGNVEGTTGKRIAKLFADGRALLAKFLDPGDAEKLVKEIVAAEKGKPITPPAAAPKEAGSKTAVSTPPPKS